MRKILVTGAAGFIGFHLTKRLLSDGWCVTGIDNINNYYDPEIKYDRLKICGISKKMIENGKNVKSTIYPEYSFLKIDIVDKTSLQKVFSEHHFDVVCHLAAQAGVRYSIENPYAYIESNISGFINLLEACRIQKTPHLVFASSSSVYGLNGDLPLSIHKGVDHPISLYAATKRSNELMAHTYSYLYKLPLTGLRFFTVYGPWGRPDMALFLFTKAIIEEKPIDVYNNGKMLRDFTFVDDIVEGIVKVLTKPAAPSKTWDPVNPDPASSSAPFRIYNIGNAKPVMLPEFISAIEKKLGEKAKKNYLPLQPGDVKRTFSDISDLHKEFGYSPKTDVEEGVGKFIDWYIDYYDINKKQ